jgi:hypothetical protein
MVVAPSGRSHEMDRPPHNPRTGIVPGQRTVIGSVYKTKSPPAPSVEAANWALRRHPDQTRHIDAIRDAAGPTPADRSGTRLRVAIVVVGSLVAACLVVLLGVNDLGTHNQLNKERSTLAASNALLSSDRSQLKQSQSQLATARSQYTKLQTTLSSVQSAVGTQTSATGLLKTCLGGVSQALEDVLDGQLGPGIQAIQAVQASCQQSAPGAVTAPSTPSGTTTPSGSTTPTAGVP